MPGSKFELITLLKECAMLMSLRGDNPFKVKAYDNGARALESLEGNPKDWIEEGTLEGVKGIGKGLAANIEEYARTGTLTVHEELQAEIPTALTALLSIPGLGAKKIQAIWKQLGIDTIDKLEEAARGDTIATLPGFNRKSADKILTAIGQRRKFSDRFLISAATRAAAEILERLKQLPAVKRVEIAGSLRRGRETVKDIDLVAESDDPESVMEGFVHLPMVERIVNHGKTKSSVLLASGIPCDLRVVSGDQYAAALNYFTGSKEHNTKLRGRAKKMGLLLNEYGLFKERDKETPLPCRDEAELYKRLELIYVEPELREDCGEIEAAESKQLPDLIKVGDMRGLLHCHTTYSDGKVSLEGMTQAAKDHGYEYFGVCDHSRTAAYAGGLKEDDVLRQHDEIDELNSRLKGIRILKGIESDILGEGQLDYPDKFLERFDFIVGSVHSRFSQSRDDMTRRICTAAAHPLITILGHPTGRLLLRRDPYDVDVDAVIEAAAKHHTAIEINASPRRLDLDWTHVQKARKAGCIFTVNPDAHSIAEIDYVPYGIGIARKGWLGADDVINTMTLKKFLAWIKKQRAGRSQ